VILTIVSLFSGTGLGCRSSVWVRSCDGLGAFGMTPGSSTLPLTALTRVAPNSKRTLQPRGPPTLIWRLADTGTWTRLLGLHFRRVLGDAVCAERDLRVAYRTTRGRSSRHSVRADWFTCCEILPELPSVQGWVEAMTSLGRLIFLDRGHRCVRSRHAGALLGEIVKPGG